MLDSPTSMLQGVGERPPLPTPPLEGEGCVCDPPASREEERSRATDRAPAPPILPIAWPHSGGLLEGQAPAIVRSRMAVKKPRVVVTRKLPDPVETRMRELFDTEL